MARGKKRRHAGTREASAAPARPAAPKPAGGEPAARPPVAPLLAVAVGLVVIGVLGWLLFGDSLSSGEEDASTASDGTELAVPWIDPDRPPPNVSAMDVNPADGSLWLGTNTGLFRVPAAGGEPQKVTGTLRTNEYGSGEISQELAIRFDGPDRLLASGHPPPDSPLPAALGLIRSEDAGKTWTEISEVGNADFHALQRSGDALVAALFGEAGINVSRDGGKTFETRSPPAPLIDLAVDPDDVRRWVAATADGSFTSADEGGTWRQVDPVPNSWLAWPAGPDLYRIDPGGAVRHSADGGRTWQDRGSTGGEPQSLTASDPERLYTILIDGTIKESRDGGRTWTDLVAP
jgi:hypothetical protein